MMNDFKRFLLSLACLLLTAAAAVPPCVYAGTNLIRRPADEAYTDADTKLVFPSRWGGFIKMEVIRNLNPVFGTTIRYQNENYSGADVYIYCLGTKGGPVSEEQFRAECADVEKNILSMKQRSDIIESVRLLDARKAQAQAAGKIFRRSFEIVIDGEKNRSTLLMFLYRGRIVKCRITFPDDSAEGAAASKEAAAFEDALLRGAGFKSAPRAVPSKP